MKLSSLSLVLALLAACQTRQTVMLAPSHARKSVPAVNHRSNLPIPVGTAGNLRQSGVVKVYGINRYVDAADWRVMHERHAIFRLEQQPAWISRSSRDENEMVRGPSVGLRKPEYAPEPLPGETSREIFQARRGIQEANEGMKNLQESQQRLTSSVEAMAKNTAEAERKLTTVVAVLNERVRQLEGDSSVSGDGEPLAKRSERGEGDVVVRSPNP